MRTSSYVIYVDLPEITTHVLLVHGYYGTYDIVTNDVADYLYSLDFDKPGKPLYGSWRPRTVAAASVEAPDQEVILHLRRRGYLTERSAEEEREFLKSAVDRLHRSRRLCSPQFVIMPTYNCNLRCPYCFQDAMRTESTNAHLLKTMSLETADRILKGISAIEARHDHTPEGYERNVGFFGGEPLLRANRPLIGHIIGRLQAMGPVRLWAATNATELDAYLDILGPGGIATLQITLDGAPDEHDRRRVHADGSGSYHQIAANIGAALQRGAAVQVRVNVDSNNVDMLPVIARTAIAEGWPEFERFDLHTVPVNAVNGKTDRKTTINTRQLADALDRLRAAHPEMAVFREQDAAIKVKAREMMSGAIETEVALKAGFCGAHDRMYILDGFGDVYACWERTGNPDIRIGRVSESGDFIPDESRQSQWRDRSAVSNPVCAKCRYVLYCGGGCAVLAESRHGRFYGNFCDEYANRFRRRVAEAYLAHAANAPAGVSDGQCAR